MDRSTPATCWEAILVAGRWPCALSRRSCCWYRSGLPRLALARFWRWPAVSEHLPRQAMLVRSTITGTMPTTSLQPLPMGVGPIQSVVPAARGLLAGWADRGPLNQYARTNYRSDQSWATWRNADCSAAALDWLLGAYGQPLGSLDDAIALVGPGTGISPSLGLLDARGPALARALGCARAATPQHRASGHWARSPSWRPGSTRARC